MTLSLSLSLSPPPSLSLPLYPSLTHADCCLLQRQLPKFFFDSFNFLSETIFQLTEALLVCNISGDLGPVYGFQWRHSGAEYKDMHTDYTGQGVDQLKEVINLVRNNPDSRRIIMCAWNPSGNLVSRFFCLQLIYPVICLYNKKIIIKK